MEDNPFSKLIEILKPEENGLSMYEGEVIKVSPLTINVAGIEVSGKELMVNPAVISGLLSGDKVLLLTQDTQLFYILCKVVSL